MKPVQARILKRGTFSLAESEGPSNGLDPNAPALKAPARRARIVPRQVVEASQQAERLLRDAEQRARELIAQAKRTASEIRLEAETTGRATAAADLAARAIALGARERAVLDQTLERQIDMARLLAERLLGEELRLEPARVVALARQVLKEASGTRRAVIEAHPGDAALLEEALGSLAALESVRIEPNPARERGHLKFITEAGVLDAALGPQLARLTAKLREALKS